MKRFFIACSLLIIAAAAISGQTPVRTATNDGSAPPKQVSGGVLNGKAISLPKPPYPPAARAVGVSGAVSVQVLINENGDVVSASAVSGHPLLRAAAVEAARGARFSPTKLMGDPVKVSGIITYNFVGPLYATRLGFALAHADRTAAFGKYSMPESLANELNPDWIQEKEILNSLTYEPYVPPAGAVKEMRLTRDTAVPPPSGVKERYTVMAASSASGFGRKLDAKSAASLRSLISLIEVRMSGSESSAWGFELGSALAIFVADIGDQTKFASNVMKIETVVDRAPSTISRPSLERVREFVNSAKATPLTEETASNLVISAEMLSNLRY